MKESDWAILSELYKNPNMTKVANLFYLTQPSLTKRLKQMEEEFQITIVNRTSKGLTFTPEGSYLAERAALYLDFMKETRSGLLALQEDAKETITLGSSYTYSKYMLSDILFRYKEQCPQTHFNVITDQSSTLFKKLLDGTIDAAFVRGDYEGSVHRILTGQNEAFLATKEPTSLSELPALSRISYTTNDKSLELLSGWWAEQFHSVLPPGMTVGYIDVAWQLIHRGFGYALCFLPEHFENQYHLCLTPLKWADGSPVARNTWFLYPKSKRLPESLLHFVRYVEQNVTGAGISRGKAP